MHFVLVYENRIMESIEIILRKKRRSIRENDGRGKSN
jgi:hypothetical protein